MARLEIVASQIVETGLTKQAGTAGQVDGHKFLNDGKVFVEAVNGSGAATRTVTFITPGDVGGLAITDRAVTVAISGTKLIGPFASGTYNQQGATDPGYVYVDEDAGTPTDITLRVFRMEPVR